MARPTYMASRTPRERAECARPGLIVAAGRGQRLGDATPKQYLALGGETVLARAVAALLAHPAVDAVRVVIHPDDRALYEAAVAGIADPRLGPPVAGGVRRADSVLAGLEALAGDAPDRVLIHDAARPFVPGGGDRRGPRRPRRGAGGLPRPSRRRRALARRRRRPRPRPPPRDGLWRAQTPAGLPLRRDPRRAPRPRRRRRSTTSRWRPPPATRRASSRATRPPSRSPPRPTSRGRGP